MANTLKMPSLVLGTTKAPLLTCATGTQVAVTDLLLLNPTGSACTATLFFYNAALGSEQPGPAGINLPAGVGSYRFPSKIFLQPGDEIRALASATASVTATLSHAVTTGAAPVASGFTPRGAYAAGSTYAVNDVVSYNGSSYASSQAGNTGHQPDTSPTYWTLLASQGTAGTNGTNGTNGGLTKGTGADVRTLTDDAKYLTAKSLADAMAFVTDTWAATYAPDFSTAFNRTVVLSGNTTLGQFTNGKDGETFILRIKQDGTGSRTVALNTTYWKLPSGLTITASTAANATDRLTGQFVFNGSFIVAEVFGFDKAIAA